jgi:DNA-binding LytR/AlgR family response regulator
MKIAICDDETSHANILHKYVKSWSKSNGLDASVQLFSSAESFLFVWSEDKSFDLLLLDIQMPGLSGMALARTIRQSDDSLCIIFVTGYSDYIDEGYDVSALHYLLKPVNEEKLFACLDRAVKKAGSPEKFILLQCGGEQLRLPQDEIVCIEAFAHEVQISTIGKTLITKKSIGELAGALAGVHFIRPHRSYIVGLKYVRQIGRNELILDNDTRIPVSRRRFDEINGAFIRFYRSRRI